MNEIRTENVDNKKPWGLQPRVLLAKIADLLKEAFAGERRPKFPVYALPDKGGKGAPLGNDAGRAERLFRERMRIHGSKGPGAPLGSHRGIGKIN